MTEKIQIKDFAKCYETTLAKLKAESSKENFQLVEDYLNASAIGRTTRKKKTSLVSRVKILNNLRVVIKYFDSKNKILTDITLRDSEEFVRAIEEDVIRTEKNRPYAEESKSQFKIYFAKILKFNLGSKAEELVNWIDSSYKEKDIIYLSEKEVLLLLEETENLETKAILSVLFDSGTRATEFLNLRFSDLEEVNEEVPYFKLNVRPEFSKTNGRKISLLWSETYSILKKYLNKKKISNMEDPIFDLTYNALRMRLAKLGKKTLNKLVKAHDLRRSSATFYASKLSYAQLCVRYGWSISSDVPQKYIAKSGIEETKLIKDFKNETLDAVKQKLKAVEEQNKILSDSIDVYQRKLESALYEFFKEIAKEIKDKDKAVKLMNRNLIPLNVVELKEP